MNQPIAFGIDFGTSTSEIAYFTDGGPRLVPDVSSSSRSPIVPSLVAIDPGDNLVIGESARGIVDSPGNGVREVKRLLGSGKTVSLRGREYRPEALAALIIRRLRENAELVLQHQVTDVVLSVPAMFPDQARQATLQAGELAGLKVVSLINEPTAAALAFGINNLDVDEKLVVLDFGGGTLDITILDMANGVIDVRASYGDPYLGGKDFDEVMMQLILSKLKKDYQGARISENSLHHLKADAEKAKMALSVTSSTWIRMPSFAADASSRSIDLEVEVTRSEFEHACGWLLDRARQCIDRAMTAAKVDIRSIGRVLLVGGTTYMPSVRSMVADTFGKIPRTDVDPDLAVAIGTCVKAACESGLVTDERRPILADVAPYGLGIAVVSMYGNKPVMTYDPLIAPNQPVPYSVSREYTLLFSDQESVEVSLYQSLDSRQCPLNTPGIVTIGVNGTIQDIPPSPTDEPHPIRVDFAYGVDGLAQLHASIPATGQSVHLAYTKTEFRMDSTDMERARKHVDALWMQNPRYRGCRSLIERAEDLISRRVYPNRKEIGVAVAALKAALEDGGQARIDECEDRLTDLLINAESE